jgi:transposase, IS5 family
MRAKKVARGQEELFRIRLERLVDEGNPLVKLAQTISWAELEDSLGKMYSPGMGRPAKPTRLMIGLHYLKYTYNLSDEEVVYRWVENPYWQFFCGMEYFEHESPIDPSLMTRWRQKVESEGMEQLLRATIKAGLKLKVIKKQSFRHVNVDTTVQEKAVSYPTDAKLCHRAREKLVTKAMAEGIRLRQSYKFLSKEALVRQSILRRGNQHKKANKQVRKVKNYLGRVIRDVKRKIAGKQRLEDDFSQLLEQAERLLGQVRGSKNKLYSLHAPEVECISKGKVHKRYEFGNKVGLVTTSRDNFIIGVESFHGNPYDGHTLARNISQATRLSEQAIANIYVDKGYRKHDYSGEAKVHIPGKGMKRLPHSLRRWLRRRNAIEPIIGHSKREGRLDRNYLKGVEGDKINAILCGCGYNIRKLLRAFVFSFFERPLFSIFSLVKFRLSFKSTGILMNT